MAFGRAEAVPGAVINVGTQERVAFIRRTYSHLAGAIAAFVLLEFVLLNMAVTRNLGISLLKVGRGGWIGVIVLFMIASWVADRWARSATSPAMQYAGLGLYVVAEAIIFLPLMLIATAYSDASVLPTAGILTLLVFAALTMTVFITGKDFSFLRGALTMGAFAALGIIVLGAIFGFKLGLLYSGSIVILAGAYVLYYTSNVLHHYRTDQHVSAALALFAAIGLLFWYILQIVISIARD